MIWGHTHRCKSACDFRNCLMRFFGRAANMITMAVSALRNKGVEFDVNFSVVSHRRNAGCLSPLSLFSLCPLEDS